jgi:hypothetical protein
MRAYAVALGTLLTIGYGCVADVAIQSSGREGRGGSVPATAAPSAVWCGGTLAPVIVEARGVARFTRPTVTLAGVDPASATLRCVARNLFGDRVI